MDDVLAGADRGGGRPAVQASAASLLRVPREWPPPTSVSTASRIPMNDTMNTTDDERSKTRRRTDGAAAVLVADDSAVNRELARSLLEGLGCEETLAASGREVLRPWGDRTTLRCWWTCGCRSFTVSTAPGRSVERRPALSAASRSSR